MKTNYHTHHYRCKHAHGRIVDYVEYAKKVKMDELGISCHVPYEDDRIPEDRMDYRDLEEYFREIEEEQGKSKDLKILKALECEYFKELQDYYEKLRDKTDYLILGVHYFEGADGKLIDSYFIHTPEDLYRYRDDAILGVKSGLFLFLAHPDLFMVGYPQWDEHCERVTEDILKCCQENNVAIEYNVNGLRAGRNYPYTKFWEYVSKNYRDMEVFVNSDAHYPEALDDKYVNIAKERVEELKLNYIEKLEVK